MKFLIAGFGSIGRRHLNNLRALGENDILLFRTHHSTLDDSGIKDFPVETDLSKALQHAPDAVIIANPTALHLEIAIPCAEAGCSILMEKPITHSMNGIDNLKAALKNRGGKFLTGFQFRFHPGLSKIREWLTNDKIGQARFIRSHWGEYLPNWHPWEDYRRSYSARAELGGGVVNTLSHPFDYLRWFFGEAENLYASTSNTGLALPVEDTADITINYRSGPRAEIHLDYLQQPPEHSLEVSSACGSIRWENTTGTATLANSDGEVLEQFIPEAGFERNHLFLSEMRHFIRLVKGQERSLCTLEDGIAVVEITEAIHRSARQGCLVKFSQ